ncbi:hypothetical protein PLICRDRAFT_144307 [Plicaturopsis crispa FD-325 SS-3]|nr:hypothetical protein PLICRDRAFT_144307 [Plicaturopsis crispa FD-325 SS-3]
MAMERFRTQFAENPALYSKQDLEPSNPGGRFGKIPGVEVGDIFKSRQELCRRGVHTRTFAGISGNQNLGAYSVVLSGAYEDDVDKGKKFRFLGVQAVDANADDSRQGATVQTQDQSFMHPDNRALQVSAETKRPVRVIRGASGKSKYAPREHYRYDGLYIVEKAYMDKGKSGHAVCKFIFRRVEEGQPPLPKTQWSPA